MPPKIILIKFNLILIQSLKKESGSRGVADAGTQGRGAGEAGDRRGRGAGKKN
jgi:hypothetical protein